MSFKLLKLVMDTRGIRPAAKLVLLALADRADDEGVCFPSIPGLCDMTGLRERGVRNAVASLEKEGLLEVSRKRGARNQYVIKCGTRCLGSEGQVRHEVPHTPARGAVVPDPTPARGALPPGTRCRTSKARGAAEPISKPIKEPISTTSVPQDKSGDEEPTDLLGDPVEASDPVVMTFPAKGRPAGDWPLRESVLNSYVEDYPGVEVQQELRKARQWLLACPTRKKTHGGMKKFLTGWLNRATNGIVSKGYTYQDKPHLRQSRVNDPSANFDKPDFG